MSGLTLKAVPKQRLAAKANLKRRFSLLDVHQMHVKPHYGLNLSQIAQLKSLLRVLNPSQLSHILELTG